MNKEYPKKIADNVTMFSNDPILYVVDDFLSEDECDAFIQASEGKLKPSTVISPDEHIQHESRTSENCWIEHDANDIVHEVSKRFSILVQMPIRNAEQYQFVYYKKGAQYKPHFDSFDYETEDGKKNWEPGGQRMVTVIAYLNDVEEGGETLFPQARPPEKTATQANTREEALEETNRYLEAMGISGKMTDMPLPHSSFFISLTTKC